MMDRWQLKFTHRAGRAFCDVIDARGHMIYRLPPYWLDRAKALVDQHNDRAAAVAPDRPGITWPEIART